MAGYRNNFSEFYINPEVGGAILDNRVWFAWAIGVGITSRGFDGGLRFERVSARGERDIRFIGIHAGYNFLLAGKVASK
jgi:hypothetical protein